MLVHQVGAVRGDIGFADAGMRVSAACQHPYTSHSHDGIPVSTATIAATCTGFCRQEFVGAAARCCAPDAALVACMEVFKKPDLLQCI